MLFLFKQFMLTWLDENVVYHPNVGREHFMQNIVIVTVTNSQKCGHHENMYAADLFCLY